jgi:hypothetical protein
MPMVDWYAEPSAFRIAVEAAFAVPLVWSTVTPLGAPPSLAGTAGDAAAARAARASLAGFGIWGFRKARCDMKVAAVAVPLDLDVVELGEVPSKGGGAVSMLKGGPRRVSRLQRRTVKLQM